jgi:predicted nucleic acid-binding protein
MAWIVDTCCLLDIANADPGFSRLSARILRDRFDDGLAACPITQVELAPQFDSDLAEIRHFLDKEVGVESSVEWLIADTERAIRGWGDYVSRRRQGHAPKRPIADILIGAFACRFDGLITRNPANFRPYFPELTVIDPTAENSD